MAMLRNVKVLQHQQIQSSRKRKLDCTIATVKRSKTVTTTTDHSLHYWLPLMFSFLTWNERFQLTRVCRTWATHITRQSYYNPIVRSLAVSYGPNLSSKPYSIRLYAPLSYLPSIFHSVETLSILWRVSADMLNLADLSRFLHTFSNLTKLSLELESPTGQPIHLATLQCIDWKFDKLKTLVFLNLSDSVQAKDMETLGLADCTTTIRAHLDFSGSNESFNWYMWNPTNQADSLDTTTVTRDIRGYFAKKTSVEPSFFSFLLYQKRFQKAMTRYENAKHFCTDVFASANWQQYLWQVFSKEFDEVPELQPLRHDIRLAVKTNRSKFQLPKTIRL